MSTICEMEIAERQCHSPWKKAYLVRARVGVRVGVRARVRARVRESDALHHACEVLRLEGRLAHLVGVRAWVRAWVRVWVS